MQYSVYFTNNGKKQFTKIEAQSAAEAQQKTINKMGSHIVFVGFEPEFNAIKENKFIDFFNSMINKK